jgi:glycosyltransferase involved in cell wall biosynthesis
MEPRKIALITPSVRLLGARRSLLALAKALDPARFSPIVVCPRRGDLEEELRRTGISTHIHALPPWRKARSWLTIPFHLWRFRRWAQDLDIRLFHCNEIYPTPYAVRVGQRLGIPTISHMRLSVNERLMRNYDLRRADRVVVVSHGAAEPFRAWPDFEQRVRVIYNGLDVKEWRQAAGDIEAARKEIRQKLALPPDAFLVGHIGLIARRKQQHLLVEAAQRIAARRADCHFLMVGDPSPNERAYAEQVAAAIESAGLARRVTIWPFRRDIAPVFAALDLNLLISSDEGFGRVAIEAGALGVPTIGTRVGGIPEVVGDGETGLLVGGSDADGLADAIERFAADISLRRRLGDAARRRVETDFTIETHALRVMELYEEVLAIDTKTGL